MTLEFNEIIFGKNDIRGKVGIDFTPELYKIIGKAYTEYLSIKENNANLIRGKWVTVGYDARKHSPELTKALIEGLVESGLNVYEMGLCPTPMGYYSEYKIPGVIGTLIVTASHNPPEYNGIKMTYNKTSFSEHDIAELKELTKIGNFPPASQKGKSEKYNIISEYIKTYENEFKGAGNGLKVVVDSANATGGIVAPELYRKMGCEVIELFSEPDGDFPNHHPNPSDPETLEDLKLKVKETNADFGIAFDGDSDRIGIVDDKGNSLAGDRFMLIFALDIIKQTKEETPVFVSEVKCSQILYDTIEQNGGRAIMWKTGHGFIKSKMKEENALMAGEMSGHIFFKDRYFGYDDAIYAGCRFIEVISQKKAENPDFSVSSFIDSFPKTFTSEEVRTPCPNEHKYRIVQELQQEFALKPDVFNNKIEKVIVIDGVRLVFKDGFALIRASNTEPVFTLRFEAGTQENLANYRTKMLEIVENKLKDIKSLC
ncbi:MAG TPA: phosphomannomutase/phosphoglucomutase [Candidatus Gastranaerophilales bacterium]|nr:phosphomannomutase/phosphoglucomutase [Candidatus Gastranaerophilales bacterium]